MDGGLDPITLLVLLLRFSYPPCFLADSFVLLLVISVLYLYRLAKLPLSRLARPDLLLRPLYYYVCNGTDRVLVVYVCS